MFICAFRFLTDSLFVPFCGRKEIIMDILKKLFPYSFRKKSNLTELVINLIVYIVVGAIIGAVIGITAIIPLVGTIVGAIGGLVELYVGIGTLLTVLDYFKIIK